MALGWNCFRLELEQFIGFGFNASFDESGEFCVHGWVWSFTVEFSQTFVIGLAFLILEEVYAGFERSTSWMQIVQEAFYLKPYTINNMFLNSKTENVTRLASE